MNEDPKPPRKPRASTIRVSITVTDREEGEFMDQEVAIAEVTERVNHADTGDRYEPVLPSIEAVAREAINKTLAQVVANETRLAARES